MFVPMRSCSASPIPGASGPVVRFETHAVTTEDVSIPTAESLWLAKDIPRAEVRDVLITGAFSHVDPEKNASLKEELRLVKFVSGVLRAAN
jgi:hypothetical protein